MDLLDHEDASIKDRASQCLETLCKSNANRRAIRSDILPRLVDKLVLFLEAGSPPVSQENAWYECMPTLSSSGV